MKQVKQLIPRKDFYYEITRKDERLISIHFRYHNEVSIGRFSHGKVQLFEQFISLEILDDIVQTLKILK